MRWVLFVVLFGVPLYSGVRFGIKRHLFGFIWTEAIVVVAVAISLLVYNDLLFLNVIPGYFLGFMLHPFWNLLFRRIGFSGSFGIVIFLVISSMYLFIEGIPEISILLTIFLVSGFVWIPVEIYEKITNRAHGTRLVNQ